MRTIAYTEYYDKVLGGWIGKCVGGNIGADVENNKYLMDLDKSEIFPEEIPPNDDLDLQLLWLQVLEDKGLSFVSRDLAEAWQKHCWYPFNEYGYFLHNFERNIEPPVSGAYNNQYFSRSMGSPIRSEIWGMIAAGNSPLAMEYAYKDATLDHDTESVWGEQMLAAMEAEAFFENDMNRLIDFGLARLPEDSELRRCIQFVRELHAEGIDWQNARQRMLERFGHPDASKAVQNLGITIVALLYGNNDFEQTQLIALNCGYDTDCTCATAGAILGMMFGASLLPEDWKQQARDTFAVGIDVVRPTNRITDLATDTCRVGVAAANRLHTGLTVTGIPEDLGWERIPYASLGNIVDITADYQGRPALYPGETKQIMLHIRNVTANAVDGILQLQVPGDCSITPSSVRLRLEPETEFVQPVYIRIKPEKVEFATSVAVTAVWEQGNHKPLTTKIGLALAQPHMLAGPFWDLYDTSAAGAESYYDRIDRRKARPRGAENFNNYVNIDRAYMPEDSFSVLPEDVRIVYADEHKLPIDEWIGTRGPICFYLVRDIEVPEEREVRLMVGNNDGFKLWVNDCLVSESKDPWFWMPYNHAVTVKLNKGKNRIVTKLVRRGDSCDYSLGLSVPNTHVRWMNDYTSVIPVSERILVK